MDDYTDTLTVDEIVQAEMSYDEYLDWLGCYGPAKCDATDNDTEYLW